MSCVGDVAQLVRALRSHRRGRGFEPLHPHQKPDKLEFAFKFEFFSTKDACAQASFIEIIIISKGIFSEEYYLLLKSTFPSSYALPAILSST